MDDGKKHWLDDRKNVDWIVRALCIACAGLILADLLYAKTGTHFAVERWFGFYGFYGFVACVLLVLVAKYVLRPLVKRGEDYYDR
jgi:hypothetical protein